MIRIARPGEGGVTRPLKEVLDEMKRELGIPVHTPEGRARMGLHHPHSEETKRKISEGKKRRHGATRGHFGREIPE